MRYQLAICLGTLCSFIFLHTSSCLAADFNVVLEQEKICIMEPFVGQNGKGVSIFLYDYDSDESGWRIEPGSYCYEYIYSSYKPNTYCLTLGGPTIALYRNLSNSNWGIMLEAGAPIGLEESITENESYSSYITKFNIDLKLQERLIYISEAEPYFVCSIGTYQRSSLLNPDFYPLDIGLTISVGTKF